MSSNNQELKLALRNVYHNRKQLQNHLIQSDNDKLTDELLDKIITINKMIEKTEFVLDMNSKENFEWYANKFPENVNDDYSINEKGIEQFSKIKE